MPPWFDHWSSSVSASLVCSLLITSFNIQYLPKYSSRLSFSVKPSLSTLTATLFSSFAIYHIPWVPTEMRPEIGVGHVAKDKASPGPLRGALVSVKDSQR